MFEKYLCENGRYEFSPKGEVSALDEAKRELRQSQLDMRQGLVDDMLSELCMLWGTERLLANPKLHPIHENVGTSENPKWVRVDPKTPESDANDAHRYNQAVAIPAFISVLAAQLVAYYDLRISDGLLRRLELHYPKWITDACKGYETDKCTTEVKAAKDHFRTKYDGEFKNVDNFFEMLETIKAKELKRYYYDRLIDKQRYSFKEFFNDCANIVPKRKGESGWNYDAAIKY